VRTARSTGLGGRPPGGRAPFDLLRVPGIGTFLRWRHARSVVQALTLTLAALILLDGWLGPQVAPRNLAGVIPWVHWRGFVVVSLLVAGNLFCMGCPFMLPRRLAKRLLPGRWAWPTWIPGKWLALVLLAGFFWGYEAFALWASPWLTAWVAAVYFVGAFVVDGFFKGAAFCRHVCPIGQFHFVHAMVSPLEVRVREPEVCATCQTKDCLRGRYEAPAPLLLRTGEAPVLAAPGQALGRSGLVQRGCELGLYLPRKEGNLDCTFCMECIHACPHDNIGIVARSPVNEFRHAEVRSGVGRIQDRLDLAALATLLVFAAFLNALGMVAPVFALEAWFLGLLGVESRQPFLAAFFLVGLGILPLAFLAPTGWLSQRLSGSPRTVRQQTTRYLWGLVPLGFGMWTAHYLFHLLIGGWTLVPVIQTYLRDLGLPAGDPRWGLGAVVPESWLFPITLLLLQGGLAGSLFALWRIAQSAEADHRSALRGFAPWALLATVLAGAGIWLFLQPMEMRGTFLAPVR
jgi:polyferredoxin